MEVQSDEDHSGLDLKGQVVVEQMRLNGTLKPPKEPRTVNGTWLKVKPYVTNKYMVAVAVGLALLILLVVIRPPMVLTHPEDPLERPKINWWLVLPIAGIGALLPVVTPMVHDQISKHKGRDLKHSRHSPEQPGFFGRIKNFFATEKGGKYQDNNPSGSPTSPGYPSTPSQTMKIPPKTSATHSARDPQ